MCVCSSGGQKRALEPQELESQAVVSCLMWVMGSNPGSSGRVACAQWLTLSQLSSS